jgi:hypothetical protein
VTDESELQIIRKDGESSLTLSNAGSGLIARGMRDAEALLITRIIELSEADAAGHLGFKLLWKGNQLWFLAGTSEIQLDLEDANKLAAVLVKGCADLVWHSPTPILVGREWRLYAAREVSDVYPRARERDVPRMRVRVQCGNHKWHLLPSELDGLGILFRKALR